MSPLNKNKLPVPTTPDTEHHLGNRRKEVRHRLEGLLSLSVGVPPGDAAIEAEVVDVAETGVGLNARASLAPGTIVTFVCAAQRVYGVVEHCHSNGAGYRIGVAIKDVVDA